jgi:OOP family OmpA-OmpF porin
VNKKFFMLPVLLALPLSANPQIKEGSVEVSPFVGFNFFDKNQNLKDHLELGGRLGYNVTKHFALEGTLEFINTNVSDKSITAYRSGQFRSPMDKVDLYFYHLDALFNFRPDERFNPFITFGFGGAHYGPKISDRDMSTVDVGVGAKVWIAERVAIRFDLRDNFVTEVSPWQKGYQNLSAAVGLVFSFGGKKKATPAPEVVYVPAPAPPPEVVYVPVATPAPPPVVIYTPAPAPAVVPKTIILDEATLHFANGKAVLSSEGRDAIHKVARELKEIKGPYNLVISGHTSKVGSAKFNQQLSKERADVVAKVLVDAGIPASDIRTEGLSFSKPRVKEVTKQDQAMNRRVEIDIQTKAPNVEMRDKQTPVVE